MKINSLLRVFALSVMTLFAQGAKAQNLVVNGSFEVGTFVNNGQNDMELAGGSTTMTGWTVTGTVLGWIFNGNPFYGIYASDGAYSLDLTGYHDAAPYGGVQQTLSTIAGERYTVSFDLGENTAYIGGAGVIVTAGDLNQAFSFHAVSGQEWKRFSANFIASSSNTVLSIVGNGSKVTNAVYIGLDNVTVFDTQTALTLAGNLTFEGIASVAATQNVTFTFRPTDGSANITRTVAVPASGAFRLSGLPPKPYTLHIKGDKYLAANVSVDATNGNVSGITAFLPAGDANNDNSVDSSDFGILIGAFNSEADIPGGGYDPNADFNGDGFVDSADFGLLIGEFNNVGAL